MRGVFSVMISCIINQMSFGSNNSRNVANLLRYEQLDPLPGNKQRNLPAITQPQQPPPSTKPPSRQRPQIRQQIPVEDVFTPQERAHRKRTPVEMQMRVSRGNEDEAHLQSLKVRLDQIVRFYDERHNNLQSKMMVRLNELENFVMREVPKIDNSTMMSSDLIAMKESLGQMRRQQQHQSNQLAALKALSKQRSGGENNYEQMAKEKEKSTVLFMEMVRLGDTVEKMSDYVSSMGKGYDNKYNELENKLANSEKNLMVMSQRTNSGSEVLNQLGDKLMSRLTTAESNLLMLGKQQVKDKEAIAKLVSQNDRVGQDLQLLLRNMQADFQSSLENRMQETVNRLMSEHQERIRSQEEIKKNLDLRQRIAAEKQMSERMENKAKYDTMDALVRAELLKKEQSIRSLHKAMEDQFRNLMTELQGEGGRRKEQEAAFRGEIKRVQDNLRKEYDLYKNHQSQLVDKITEMIKSEIEVRLSTQLDLKKLTSNIAHQIVNDVNNLKQALATSNKKLSYAIRQASNESAERAGQLSHYVDSEVKKVVEVVTEKYSKMKSVFTKLAEQLRNHLQNTQTNRKNVEGRLSSIQEDFQKLKNEVNGEIDQFYNDLEARLKEQKEFVETVVFKKNNDLTVRVSKLEEYTNQYFELLKAGIEDNKDLLSKKITGLGDGPSANEEELKDLRGVIFQIKSITEEIKAQNEGEFQQMRKDIKAVESASKEELLELENKVGLRFEQLNEKEQDIEEQINQVITKINNLRADTNAATQSIAEDKIKKLSDEIDEVGQRINQVNNKTVDNEAALDKVNNDVTVIRSEITKLENKILRDNDP